MQIVSLTGANVTSGAKYREKYAVERAVSLAQKVSCSSPPANFLLSFLLRFPTSEFVVLVHSDFLIPHLQSTASLGRFDEKLADEPKIKRKQKVSAPLPLIPRLVVPPESRLSVVVALSNENAKKLASVPREL